MVFVLVLVAILRQVDLELTNRETSDLVTSLVTPPCDSRLVLVLISGRGLPSNSILPRARLVLTRDAVGLQTSRVIAVIILASQPLVLGSKIG